MKWLRVEESVQHETDMSIASETWAANIPCGVLVRHVILLGTLKDAELRMTESLLFIHGGVVNDLGDDRGELIGA